MPVEFYQDDDTYRNKPGQFWRWRLKANNGEIVAQGEGHSSKADARRAYETMRQVAIQTVDELQAEDEKETT